MCRERRTAPSVTSQCHIIANNTGVPVVFGGLKKEKRMDLEQKADAQFTLCWPGHLLGPGYEHYAGEVCAGVDEKSERPHQPFIDFSGFGGGPSDAGRCRVDLLPIIGNKLTWIKIAHVHYRHDVCVIQITLQLFQELEMKLIFLTAAITLLSLGGCKPSTPPSPDPSSYGKVITPDHHVPKEHQDKNDKG